MDLVRRKTLLYVLLAVVLLCPLLLLKLPVEQKIPVKIYPLQECTLRQLGPDQISFLTTNYLTGEKHVLFTFVASRGDQFYLKPLGKFHAGQYVAEQTPLFKIQSLALEQKLLQVQNDLAIKQAELAVFSSGEKAEIVNIYQNEYQGLRDQLKIEQQILTRKQQLLKKKLIAPEEFQLQQAKVVALQSEVNALKAKIEGLSTGAKKEQIDLIKTELASLQQEYHFLQQRDSSLIICSPFNGIVSFPTTPDTIFHLIDLQKSVGLFLIPLRAGLEQLTGKQVLLKDKQTRAVFQSKVVRMGKQAMLLKGQNMISGFVEIKPSEQSLLPGMVLIGSIRLSEKRIYQHIWQFLTTFFES